VVDATNNWGEPLHTEPMTTEPSVRVVLAEAAVAPGPLHYLLESEGFQVLGSAADDDELARILAGSARPEVIVVDAAVPATATAVAHEFAPDAELIVIWPEGVVPPAWADQVVPELVYQDLGTAVYRAADRHRLRRPAVEDPDVVVDDAIPDLQDEPTTVAARRSAARVLVGTVALIAAIIVTMGVSFALEGWRASHLATPPREPASVQTATGAGRTSPAGSIDRSPGSTKSPTDCAATDRPGPNAHAPRRAQQQATGCPSGAGGANGAGHGQSSRSGGGAPQGSGDQGADHGSGNGQGTGQGSGHGQAGTHGPGDHPTGPPSVPPGGDHASPKD
jgi:hypothetical protein